MWCKLIAIAIALVQTPTPPPTTAAGYTAMFAAKNDTVWSGGDQTTSYRARNGLTYWLFGDTMQGTQDPDGGYADGAQMVANQILIQRGNQLVDAVPGDGPAIPDPPTATEQNQERYWAQAAVQVGSHLYVLAQRVRRVEGGLGFQPVGVEWAKYTINPSNGRLVLVSMVATPSTGVVEAPGPAHIQWAGDVITRDGYLYIYGYTRALPDNPFVTHHSYLARVQTTKVEQPAEWEYYRRSTGQWMTQLSDLNPNPDIDGILPSQISSVRIIDGQTHVLHKPWAGLGSEIRLETGPDPWGPFTSRKVLDSPAGTVNGHSYITYSPMLHPQLAVDGGLLISVSYNGSFAGVAADADLYKPRFYTIDRS